MKTLLFFASVGIISMLIYPNDVQIPVQNQSKPVDKSDHFHDDFDSTYFYYGCKAYTFKSKHICHEKN
jgi:hypothetical protein